MAHRDLTDFDPDARRRKLFIAEFSTGVIDRLTLSRILRNRELINTLPVELRPFVSGLLAAYSYDDTLAFHWDNHTATSHLKDIPATCDCQSKYS